MIVEGGYIRVVQDVRGKYGSEGDYVMNRPLHGPQNPTPVDHATDTYDTIDWLVKNVPESNGRVGILGISYDGFLPLMALVNPHPALKVLRADEPDGRRLDGRRLVPQRRLPPADDGLHLRPGGDRKSEVKWWTSHYDDYDMFLQAGSAGELGRRRGLEQVGFWRKLLEHPSYDAFWRDQAVDKMLAAPAAEGARDAGPQPLGPGGHLRRASPSTRRSSRRTRATTRCSWSWAPGITARRSGTAARSAPCDSTATPRSTSAGRSCARSWTSYLKDGAPKADLPPVTAFETGTNAWRRLPAWPAGCASGCSIRPTPLYLAAGLKLSFAAPKPGDAAFEEYVSDPAKPVPFRARPIRPTGAADGSWPRWLVDDQREASGRPDVLAFVSDVLTAPVKISGQPVANLVASTSGTDSDWVVKLIDVYPDEVAGQPAMGGYQLMVSADIFRGRYRESLETAKPIAANQPLLYRFALPDGQPRLPAGPPDHGAGPVELVPALRPQSADLRAQHLLGEAGGLPKGRAAGLPRSRPGELHRAAPRGDALTAEQSAHAAPVDSHKAKESTMPASQVEKGERFRALHARPGAFVIPNPWDAGTARILTGLGFEALTTTSAGLAFTLGKRDGAGRVTREETLANAKAIVDATDLPVAGDLENGFGDAPGAVAETIRLAGEVAGLVGGSIEDSTGDPQRPLYDFRHAVERVAAAAEAARKLPSPFVLVGRAENYIHGRPDLDDTLRRLQAFEAAGADVLYAPGLTRDEDIRTVCASVSKPVNVVMGLTGVKGTSFSVSGLAALGVRRISLGASLSRAALGAFVRAAREVRERGTFGYAEEAITYAEANALVAGRR